MKNMQLIKEIIKEENKEAHLIKGFDEALIGTGKSAGGFISAVYDATLIIGILMRDHNMSGLEAYEHFNNSLDREHLKNAPIFVNDFREIVNPDDIIDDNFSLI